MSGLLSHRDSPLILAYKQAGSQGRINILQQAKGRKLPLWLDDDNKTPTYNEMVDIFQLNYYAYYTTLIETQQFFAISFDPKALINQLGQTNEFFEIHESGIQMRLKKPIDEIPYHIWLQIRTAQQTFLGNAFQQFSADLNVHDIFTPPDVEFRFGAWYDKDPIDNHAYDEAQEALFNDANQVCEAAEQLKLQRIKAINTASEKLRAMTLKKPKLHSSLLKVHKEVIKLLTTENLDTLALVMTRTVDLFNGRFNVQQYETLLNNVYGHAKASNEMKALCQTMLQLCTAAVAIGVIAAAAPLAFGAAAVLPASIAAGTAAVSATLFAAGATYSFFAIEETEQTGLSLAMSEALQAKNEDDQFERSVARYDAQFR